MENQKKSTGKTALIAVLLLVAVAAIIFATYAWAKYTTTIDKEANVAVAKWDVGFTTGAATMTTYTNVAENHLAPGTQGQVAMTLSSANTEVAYTYTISIKDLANKPTNLRFYADEDCTKEITSMSSAITGKVSLDSTTKKATVFSKVKVNGTEEIGNVTSTPTIYWKWAETTNTAVSSLTTEQQALTSLAEEFGRLALAKGATEDDVYVDASAADKEFKSAATLLTLLNSNSEVTAIDINNAIDTAEGRDYGASSMTFKVLYTATQETPAA